MERLQITPCTLTEAHAFVAQKHRHHRPAQGGLFAVAASIGEEVVGVAVIGRPISRMLDDGWTAEVTRLATDGSKNACSMLYRAAWRACRALGYRKLVTYTLSKESGASLRGAGFKEIGKAGGGSWSVPSRPRVDKHPLQEKIRWELTA
jgi:tRNA A37 N6-isopentenylltransferase MiaA